VRKKADVKKKVGKKDFCGDKVHEKKIVDKK
jgi:hypothetical protein